MTPPMCFFAEMTISPFVFSYLATTPPFPQRGILVKSLKIRTLGLPY